MHACVRSAQSLESFSSMARLDKTAVYLENGMGRLPLHVAAHRSRSVPILRCLLELYPQALSKRDNLGFLPIHCASENESFEVFKYVHDMNTALLQVPANNDLLPIHLACYKCENIRTVEFLIHANPQTLMAQDTSGKSPLHYACITCEDVSVFQTILENGLMAATIRDNFDRCPLHILLYECDNDYESNTLQCLSMLIEAFPAALKMVDRSGNSPFDIAISRNLGADLIRDLDERMVMLDFSRDGLRLAKRARSFDSVAVICDSPQRPRSVRKRLFDCMS